VAKECPNCGLVNPPHAQRCDCGYRFASGRVERSLLDDRDRATNERHAEALRPVVPVSGGCLGFLFALLIVHGSNKLGLFVAGVSLLFVLPLAGTDLGAGGFFGAWGALAIAIDIGIRKFLYRGPILDVHGGSRFVFMPGWLFGLLVFLIGVTVYAANVLV
jgi:hypothetical protein